MFKSNLSKLVVVIIIATFLSISSCVLYKATKKSVPLKETSREVTAVSDLDAHSQSQMNVTIEGDSVIAI
ncbi:MAG: hypothetical protein KAW56_16005, partial [Candidatus Marinimicrobia bacterium]|nr:hypothetical protein [Candidatus Neomarinimicrobiota bacterium]